ncbi:hypothetical protein N0V90_005730 [Kalmusia sp. IMI 367209]|nr:hypothetical protein N0V90_005730 [Kalmusia sp. IMI 367209]
MPHAVNRYEERVGRRKVEGAARDGDGKLAYVLQTAMHPGLAPDLGHEMFAAKSRPPLQPRLQALSPRSPRRPRLRLQTSLSTVRDAQVSPLTQNLYARLRSNTSLTSQNEVARNRDLALRRLEGRANERYSDSTVPYQQSQPTSVANPTNTTVPSYIRHQRPFGPIRPSGGTTFSEGSRPRAHTPPGPQDQNRMMGLKEILESPPPWADAHDMQVRASFESFGTVEEGRGQAVQEGLRKPGKGIMSGQGQSYEQDPRWTAVDTYSLSHLHPASSTTPSNAVLDHARTNSEKQGLPDIAVSPSQGKFLKIQAQLVRAKHILEVGTLGGYSTIWLASASPHVRVTTVEVDAHHADVARANLDHAGVADRVDVRLGPGVDVLPQLAEEIEQGKKEKFQLVFIDADKVNNWNYVDAAVAMSEPGAVIIVDNVVRKGQLANADGDANVQGARRVVENIGKDSRLDGVVVQTVGEKNYDGFLIAIVK